MILVTGATGKIGSRVVDLLATRGLPVRAQVRSAERAQAVAVGAEVAVATFENPEALDAAVSGCSAVLLISPPGPEQLSQEGAVIDAVARSGTGAHIVKIGALGMGDPAAGRIEAQHATIREALRKTGLPWTVLALSQLMDNLFLYAEPIMTHGVLPVPAGDALVAWVNVEDVAAVAAAAVSHPGLNGETLEVTGPRAIHHADLARLLTGALGRDVSYLDVPGDAAVNAMVAAGIPVWVASGVVETNAFYQQGGAASVSQTVPEIGGVPFTTMEQFLENAGPVFVGATE